MRTVLALFFIFRAMIPFNFLIILNFLLRHARSEEYIVNINNTKFLIETEDNPTILSMNKGVTSEEESKETAPNNAAGTFVKTDNENEKQKEVSNEKEELSGKWKEVGVEIDNENMTKELVSAAGSIDDEDTYDYEEENIDAIPEKSEGSRLVGAKAASTDKFAFLVAWNDAGKLDSKCSGSLISSHWFLTAAHCTELIPRRGRDRLNKECLRKTKQGKSFDVRNTKTGVVRHFKCRQQKTKPNEGAELENLSHLVFYEIEPKPVAWIGVDDVNDEESWKKSGNMRTIAEIVRHAQTYKGGGAYGSYGGHDISLVKLDKPVTDMEKACLPGPRFKDAGVLAKLAGYGRYHRNGGKTCQTDQHGKYKYHYCQKLGGGSEVCNLDKKGQAKPAPRSKKCKKFFNHKDTPEDIPVDKDEMMILNRTSGEPALYSYRQFSPADLDKTQGWCRIKGDFYNPQKKDLNAKGWGFCSKDCFLDENEASSGKLRAVHNKNVLDDKLCQKFLNFSLSQIPKVRPQVLCVGMQKSWKTAIWEITDGGYQEMEEDEAEKVLADGKHFGDHLGRL